MIKSKTYEVQLDIYNIYMKFSKVSNKQNFYYQIDNKTKKYIKLPMVEIIPLNEEDPKSIFANALCVEDGNFVEFANDVEVIISNG